MSITLVKAQEMLDTYVEAEIAVLGGQSFKQTTGNSDREWTLADIKDIQKGREYWEKRVNQLTAGRSSKRKSFGAVI